MQTPVVQEGLSDEGCLEVVKLAKEAAVDFWQKGLDVAKGVRVDRLVEAIQVLFPMVKSQYPEAKYRLVVGHDGEGFTIEVFTNETSSWMIHEIVRAPLQQFGDVGLSLMPRHLEELELDLIPA